MPISPNPPDTTAPSARSGLPIETHTDHHEVARSPGSPPLQPPRCSNRAPHIRHLAWGLLGLAIALALSRLDWNALAQPLFNVALALEAPYTAWLDARLTGGFPPWGLPLLSFLGGLAASFSPCVLGLLPVNLSYIGTQQVRSRRAATIRASGFVLGVATTYSLLGLFSALAGAILIAYRGYVSLGVGLLIGVMVLSLLGWIRLPLPQPPPNPGDRRPLRHRSHLCPRQLPLLQPDPLCHPRRSRRHRLPQPRRPHDVQLCPGLQRPHFCRQPLCGLRPTNPPPPSP